ncbi:MAG: M48 family metalloprotease [Planctomycetota bacterium]
MKKLFGKNLIPLLFPVIVWGCTALQRAAHGDFTGAAVEGGKAVVGTGIRMIEKYCEDTDQVNISQEYYVGRGSAANVFSKYKRVHDPALERYVRKVGETVGRAAKSSGAVGLDGAALQEPYKGYFFAVIEDRHVNAFSAPGGFVFITTAALRAMKTEDELACVLAHEIGHVMDRHGIRYVLEQQKFSIPFEAVGEEVAARSPELVGKYAKQFTGMCGELATKAAGGLGTEYELKADELGAKFAANAGYDPQGLIEFIKRTRHGEDLK